MIEHYMSLSNRVNDKYATIEYKNGKYECKTNDYDMLKKLCKENNIDIKEAVLLTPDSESKNKVKSQASETKKNLATKNDPITEGFIHQPWIVAFEKKWNVENFKKTSNVENFKKNSNVENNKEISTLNKSENFHSSSLSNFSINTIDKKDDSSQVSNDTTLDMKIENVSRINKKNENRNEMNEETNLKTQTYTCERSQENACGCTQESDCTRRDNNYFKKLLQDALNFNEKEKLHLDSVDVVADVMLRECLDILEARVKAGEGEFYVYSDGVYDESVKLIINAEDTQWICDVVKLYEKKINNVKAEFHKIDYPWADSIIQKVTHELENRGLFVQMDVSCEGGCDECDLFNGGNCDGYVTVAMTVGIDM